jgi:hypothetical protein
MAGVTLALCPPGHSPDDPSLRVDEEVLEGDGELGLRPTRRQQAEGDGVDRKSVLLRSFTNFAARTLASAGRREKVRTMELWGLWVRLFNLSLSDTNDHIYVGVFGRGGGREFPLESPGPDFGPGDYLYWVGTVWEGHRLENARQPRFSDYQNDPGQAEIDLDRIDYVYLRKQGDRSPAGDDAWQFDWARVDLYGTDPAKRAFKTTGKVNFFGNEFGHQIWLAEEPAG